MTGLVNCDADETAAQIFDNGIMINVVLMFGHYYRNRVLKTPLEYCDEMVKNEIGRMDLDGICPYTGEDENGELTLPCEATMREYLDSKAEAVKWSDGMPVYGGRPWEFMDGALQTMMKFEKIMRFLVEAGFTPERLAFLKPLDKKRTTNEQRTEMRKRVSQFAQRVFKRDIPGNGQLRLLSISTGWL